MLSSTRASSRALGALAAPSSSFLTSSRLISQCLPAESSRQALQRALARQRSVPASGATSSIQTRRIHRRTGSTSAAAAVVVEDRHHSYTYDEPEPHWDRRLRETEKEDNAVEPKPPDKEPIPRVVPVPNRPPTTTSHHHHERSEFPVSASHQYNHDGKTTLSDTFLDQLKVSPLDTLLSLRALPPTMLASLTLSDLQSLLKSIRLERRQNRAMATEVDHQHIEEAMTIVSNLLYDLPSPKDKDSRYLGRAMRRGVLSQFLRTCSMLDCDKLLKSVFRERARVHSQQEDAEAILEPGSLAQDLAHRQKYRLLIDLIAPPSCPTSALSPKAISHLLEAYLLLQEPFNVVRMFRLHSDLGLKPNSDSYNHLIQAHLQMGDVEAARNAMALAEEAGVDLVSQQLAILWGYRALSVDDDLETRVLADIDSLKMRPRAGFLHALIRLRLDAKDFEGAERLLHRFRTGLRDGGNDAGGYVKPTRDTFILAFEIHSNGADIDEVRDLWRVTTKAMGIVPDEMGALLVRRLAELGRLDMALDVIHAATRNQPDISPIPIPAAFSVGIRTLNSFLDCSCRHAGFDGLKSASALFRQTKTPTDETTLKILINFCSSALIKSPLELSKLLDGLLRQNTHLKPSVKHIDAILAAALRAGARQYHAQRQREIAELDQPAHPDSRPADAGLRPRDQFQVVLGRIMQSLRQRGATSSKTTLAHRLRFDALTNATTSSGTPSARLVWNDMITRGFKPDKRHFLALMKGYSDAWLMSEVEDLIVLARQVGIETTNGMWMVLLSGYGRKETLDIAKAEEAYKALKWSKDGLDTIAICTMIQAYQRARRYKDAVALALELTSELLEKPRVAGHLPGNPLDQASRSSTQTGTSTSRADNAITLARPSKSPGKQLGDQAIYIASDALRAASEFSIALDLIQAYSPLLTSRIRTVVKSIRSICHARAEHAKATQEELDVLNRAEGMLAWDEANNPDRGKREIGEKGMRKKVLRAFQGVGSSSSGRR